MNVSYLYVNIIACACFFMMFLAFFGVERSREMRAFVWLLFVMLMWSVGSLFMRLNVFPSYQFWYYVSLLSLFSIPALIYNYAYQFANIKNRLALVLCSVLTLVILIVSATGFFLAPPIKTTDASGMISFEYNMDWKIGIAVVLLLTIVAAIIKLFLNVLKEKGKKAPGLIELIIGCFLLLFGNVIEILPGNTFPWDMMFGIGLALMFTVSLYKRRMFNAKLVISSGLLVLVSALLCIFVSAYFFSKLVELLTRIGGHLGTPQVEAFIILSVFLFITIMCFRKFLTAVFSDEEHLGSLIKKYSDFVSKTLDIDSILRETVKVIKNEVHVNQMYICLLEKEQYVPVCSAMPLKPADFTISADHPCVKCFENAENSVNHIILRDFESDPIFKSMWGSERELLNSYGITCIFALKDADSVVGLLLLNDKEKGLGYTYSDFSFLNTVSSIASIAIKNAALYKQVAEREHLFSSMTAFIPNVIAIKPKDDDKLSFISSNTERTLGIPQEYFTENTAMQLMEEYLGEDRAKEIQQTMLYSTDAEYVCEIPFKSELDGAEKTLRCSFSPIITFGIVSHYVCVVNDITRDIQAQELLKNSVELAQSSNKAKSEFLSHISHEIRTPMNSIAGLTYLAREIAVKDENEEMSEYLEQIDQSSQYLLSLLNNIMDMSKIENRKFELNDKPFDLLKVIDEIYAVYSPQMAAKSIEFCLENDAVKHTNIMGDELALRKILNNLLSNAFKYTTSGGKVTFKASEKIISDKSLSIHFEISDTGVGISEEFIDKLFEPYTQEMTENGSKGAGSGLGMAICKSLVDLQGGNIEVRSRLGQGTSFFVDIPYGLCESIEQENEELDCSCLAGKRIMVVDDVSINTVITKRLLEKHGVIVDCAGNGQEAVELFNSKTNHYYDCILMDIQMPIMNGIEAANEIRASKKRYAPIVPILAMTADAFINETTNAVSEFCDLIIKPVRPDELYRKLVQLLREN